jgi:phosphoenolpyruvate synthase/pyruvate phosphate dikinase
MSMRSKIEDTVKLMSDKISELQKREKHSLETEIISFEHIYEKDIYKFGSKATELAEISRALKKQSVDAEVPKGIGISKFALDIYMETAMQSETFRFLNAEFETAVRNKDLKKATDTAAKIRDIIDLIRTSREKNAEKARKNLSEAVLSKLKKNVKYSSRTSGVGEDSANKAFAGMGETKLNVSYNKIIDAIEESWKSFYAPRSVEYMIENSIIVYPAVAVQEMADSVESAGVAFSRGEYGLKTNIEVVYGLGEGLVSGAITPDRITVDSASKETIEYSVADKRHKIVSKEAKEGVETILVDKDKRKVRVLSAHTVKNLTEIIIALEKDAGYPVDVEFAIGKEGKIYILQRRPITSVERNVGTSVFSDATLTISSENINENLQSPIMYIVHPYAQEETVGIYFSNAGKNGTIALKISNRYNNLAADTEFIRSILDRINTDKAARDKLNSYIPINVVRVIPGKFNVVPYNSEVLLEDFTRQQLPRATDMRDLLSAA